MATAKGRTPSNLDIARDRDKKVLSFKEVPRIAFMKDYSDSFSVGTIITIPKDYELFVFDFDNGFCAVYTITEEGYRFSLSLLVGRYLTDDGRIRPSGTAAKRAQDADDLDEFFKNELAGKKLKFVDKKVVKEINFLFGGYTSKWVWTIDFVKDDEEVDAKNTKEGIRILEQRDKQETQKGKKKELSDIQECVNSWHVTRYGIPHSYLFEYLKTTAERDADQKEWDIRHLIWAFKNNPEKKDRKYTYEEALSIIIPQYESCLKQTFGNKLSQLTFVCIPASSSLQNNLRWKTFSKKICEDLNMYNGYDYISVARDAVPKHLGGDGNPLLKIDESFFKEKYVILCDDVKTTGNSLSCMKTILESRGANVICALTIGLTIHE